MSETISNQDTRTRFVLIKGLKVGGLVYSELLGGWRFIPHIPGRKGSNKRYSTYEEAIPEWCRKWKDKMWVALKHKRYGNTPDLEIIARAMNGHYDDANVKGDYDAMFREAMIDLATHTLDLKKEVAS